MTTRFSKVLQGRSSAVRPCKIAVLDATAEEQHAAGIGKVAMHAVEFRILDLLGHLNLVFDYLVGFAFDQRVPAEFAGEHNQSAVEQPARLQVEHQLGDRARRFVFSWPRRGYDRSRECPS